MFKVIFLHLLYVRLLLRVKVQKSEEHVCEVKILVVVNTSGMSGN